jgi:hypothetical protein
MRFLLMVIIAVATGALSMTAMQTLMPTNASMREAVQALGGAWAGFQIVDYNPLTAYQRDQVRVLVRQQSEIIGEFGVLRTARNLWKIAW